MKQSLLTDLQVLTQLPAVFLNKLSHLSEVIICDGMNELDMSSDDILMLDIGFGAIYFLVSEDTIQYQFVPSKSLEDELVKTLETKTNPLTTSAENSLETKLTKAYKELL